ncbi:MAG: carboxypeptidase regulatory-like domain-containing protein [Deltaproteobacteria bacterium]|nr:carboxypeptidase regulatory-like domain-containing protein [Deltaproteobacteria bacterium]MBI3390219.1 carboxypeptidase regulatory-like domain-containing protein [Deltaproteobacteria bacterium]
MSIGMHGQRTGFGMRLLAVAVSCAMVGAPALAASRATLGGKIVNAAGKPVGGATVLVLRPGSDSVLFSTTSGDNGLYAVEGVAVGTYNVKVVAPAPLRGDTVKAELGEKGLIVNWRLSANDKAAAIAVPGKVGGEESELCSPVQIGEYEINRCYLIGGVALVGLGVGLGVGLSGGGGGGGGGEGNATLTPTGGEGHGTPTITGTRPTATITGTRPVEATPTSTTPPTATGTRTSPTPTGSVPPSPTATTPPTATLTLVPTLTPTTPVGPTASPTCETCNR